MILITSLITRVQYIIKLITLFLISFGLYKRWTHVWHTCLIKWKLTSAIMISRRSTVQFYRQREMSSYYPELTQEVSLFCVDTEVSYCLCWHRESYHILSCVDTQRGVILLCAFRKNKKKKQQYEITLSREHLFANNVWSIFVLPSIKSGSEREREGWGWGRTNCIVTETDEQVHVGNETSLSNKLVIDILYQHQKKLNVIYLPFLLSRHSSGVTLGLIKRIRKIKLKQ